MVGLVDMMNIQALNHVESILKDCSTNELSEFLLEVKKRFENKTLERPTKEGIYPNESSYFTMGLACVNILKKREGKWFVYNLTGIKKPKTLSEKIKFNLKEIYYSLSYS
ncbi:MAG: hypothetical protein WC812_04830 [Candidatus Pacearchaeota archaeon]|jgi:hypothetical protein